MSISDPEYFFTIESGKANMSEYRRSQAYINGGRLEARILELENQRERDEALEQEMEKKAKEREEAKKFNAQPPYKKLSEMLVFHAKYLSKSSNPEDIELAQMIYAGLYELRNRNFEPMDNVFKILETRAINNSDLAIALQDWKKFYDELKQALGASVDSKKENLERKRSEYDRVSFFGRAKRATIAFFNIMSGKEEIEEKGKQI